MSEEHTETVGLDGEALERYVEELEEKHAERKTLNEAIREVYAQIKQAGMDPATVRQMVRERRLEPEVRADQYRLRNEYREALGLFADTPLGEAAINRPIPFADQPMRRPRGARSGRLKLFDAEHPQGAA